MINYNEMAKELNTENNWSSVDVQIQSDLIGVLLGQLTPAQKRKVAKKLEQERESMSSPNHPIHRRYANKVRVCAMFQEKTT